MTKGEKEMQETEIILTHDKYIKMEIEPIEINDETIEKTKRALVDIYGMIKKKEEKKE